MKKLFTIAALALAPALAAVVIISQAGQTAGVSGAESTSPNYSGYDNSVPLSYLN